MGPENQTERTVTDTTPRVEALGATIGQRDRGLLIEMSGNHAGNVHRVVTEDVSIGRGSRCTLSFEDSTLSRMHASLRRRGQEYEIYDLGSLNGTFVNRERVSTKVLAHGDRLRFGSGVRMHFQLVNETEEQVLVHLFEAAVRDGLTGVFNRRALTERLDSEVAHALRHKRDLCALMLDVDHFKRVNDTHGHLAGDEVLRAIAGVLGKTVRCEDIVARYGGEEFVVLVRDTPLAGAVLLAERLRQAVESEQMSFEGTILSATASIGVAALSAIQEAKSQRAAVAEHLLAAADAALYEAKRTGRNKVVAAS